MKELIVYEKGEKVRLEYEIESLFFKNGTIYYKLKEPMTGTYLNTAYTADELIPVPAPKQEQEQKQGNDEL